MTEHSEFYNVVIRGAHKLTTKQVVDVTHLIQRTFELTMVDALQLIAEAIDAGDQQHVLCSFAELKWAAKFTFAFRLVKGIPSDVDIIIDVQPHIPDGILCRITPPPGHQVST